MLSQHEDITGTWPRLSMKMQWYHVTVYERVISTEVLRLRNQEASQFHQRHKTLQDQVFTLEAEVASRQSRIETLEAELKKVDDRLRVYPPTAGPSDLSSRSLGAATDQ